MSKKTILSIVTGLFVTFFLASCGGSDSDSGSDDPMLSVSPFSVTLEADGSAQTVSIMSNTSWTVVVTDPWIVCSQISGSGNSVISVGASANTGEERVSKLHIFDKTGKITAEVQVTQKSGVPASSLTVSKTSFSFTDKGGSDSFAIMSNTTWTVSSDQTWCTVSPTSGSNNGTVTLTVAANSTYNDRTAIITVKGGIGSTSKTIRVTQSKKEDTTDVGRNDYDNDENMDNK